MSIPRALYVLPVPRFFSQINYLGGHITHACGVVKGLVQAGYHLDILVEEKHPFFKDSVFCTHILPLRVINPFRRFLWGWWVLNRIIQISRNRKYRFIYCRYSCGFIPQLIFLGTRLPLVPKVIEVNSFASQKSMVFHLMDWMVFNNADIVLCVSEMLKIDLIRRFGTNIESKIIIIPNGVDIERFRKIHIKKTFSGRIGYIGILKSGYCNVETLLEAFQIIKKRYDWVSLHIYGDGPHRRYLEKLSQYLKDVYFHGSKPFEEVPEILERLDITVNTTISKHMSPIKVYEYMAAGKIIISADTPQVRDLFEQDKCGWLYPPGNVGMLAERIEKIIHDPMKALEAAIRAKKAATRYSWSVRVSQMLNEMRVRGIECG